MSTAELGGIDIRKTQLVVEEIWHERGPVRAHPVRVATAAAVVGNPFAGRYEQHLIWFQERMRAVGRRLSCMLLEVIDRDAVGAFGTGATVGAAGEREHGPVWHEAGGGEIGETL